MLISAASLFCIGLHELQQKEKFESEESAWTMNDNNSNLFKEGTYHRKIEDSIYKYSKQLELKKNIELKMYGLDRNLTHQAGDHTIDTLALTYSIDQHLGYQDARALFYEIANEFIAHMNAEKELSQFFYKPPISYEHLDFKLSFNYDRAGSLKVGEVASIQIENNKISYSIVEKESPEQIEFIPTGDPEIFTLGNFCFNTRWVSRPLPETEQDIATEP
jgi:hypothetical protein